MNRSAGVGINLRPALSLGAVTLTAHRSDRPALPIDASVAENTIGVSLQRVSLVSGVLQVRPVEEGLRASRRAAPSPEICNNTVLSRGVLICSIGNWGAAAVVTRLVAEAALAYYGMLPSDQPQAPTQS